MNDSEVREKYGISKRLAIMIFIQLILIIVAFGITVVGIIRSDAIPRIIIYCGQALSCIAIIVFGFVQFKNKNRGSFKNVVYAYGLLEALRAALLSTTGIDPAIGGTCRFLLIILACNCVLLADNLDNYRSERISMALVVWETLVYLFFLLKFPGVMAGHINRILPFAGVLIAGSVALFIKAQNEQLGIDYKNREPIKKWQTISIVGICVVVVMTSLIVASINRYNELNRVQKSLTAVEMQENDKDKETIAEDSPFEMFSSWTAESNAKREIISYMASITDMSSDEYIPPEDRIAVFALDGTIMCNTYPGYFDHILYNYRVLDDTGYKDKASEEQKAMAAMIKDYLDTGIYPGAIEAEYFQLLSEVFKGMDIPDFVSYVQKVRDLPAIGFSGMTRKDAFYKPMMDLIKYLESNDFKVYIVTGTDRIITRGLLEGVIDLPANQIIGSDMTLMTQNQEEQQGFEYDFKDGDWIVLGGNTLSLNLDLNKITSIEREIGKKPVLTFGSDTSDFGVARYVSTDNKYKSLSFIVCNDDMEREYGNLEFSEEMYSKCNEFEWIPISMKNDWETIYGK